MLKINRLSKTFNAGTPAEVIALDSVDLELTAGSFTLILGSNGSGKSTLLNLIAGNYFADSGAIELNGADIGNLTDFKRSVFISRIFQDPATGTAPELSVIENFRIASLRTKSKGLGIGVSSSFKQQVKAKLASLEMGLENRLLQPMSSFSGGQRQAMALLMATFEVPQLLLLDEPVAALDPKAATLIKALASRIIREQNITALMVTHDLRDCLDMGDRIIQMQNGKIIRDISGANKNGLKLPELYEWFN